MKYVLYTITVLMLLSCALSQSVVHVDTFKEMQIQSVHVSYFSYNSPRYRPLIDSIQSVLSHLNLTYNDQPVNIDSGTYDLHMVYKVRWNEKGTILNRVEISYTDPMNDSVLATSKFVREGHRQKDRAYKEAMTTIRETFYQNNNLTSYKTEPDNSMSDSTRAYLKSALIYTGIATAFIFIYANFFVARLPGG